ncbi:Dynein light chain [Carex littledalei]|uniref:Dynein light chain n=1 Tax=Carex littledalei TaxID=544730 RepID=A0A833R9F9_9POAL|nr:Dynein light chain [Carex littledalei]
MEEKKRVDAASEELERRSKYLSSLIERTKIKSESDQEEATTDRRKNKEKVKEEDRGVEAVRGGGELDKEFMKKIRVRAADMAPALQRRAFRCAREVFDAMPKLENKRLALALKKEFDTAYGPAWHCIVGTSFGSYVTHSLGGFLYFSIDKVYVLLFRTAVEPLAH